MSDMPEQIDVIRARAARATPGPWAWFGNTDVRSVYLATRSWGRHYVMNFGRWGTQQAEPIFYSPRQRVDSNYRSELIGGGVAQRVSDIPVYAPDAVNKDDDRVYRRDLVNLRNADAQFIAHSREDIDVLIKLVDALEAQIAEGVRLSNYDGANVRQVGWICEHRYGTVNADNHMEWNSKKQKMVVSKNTSSSMQHIHSWRPDAHRCPHSVPMFVAVPEDARIKAAV